MFTHSTGDITYAYLKVATRYVKSMDSTTPTDNCIYADSLTYAATSVVDSCIYTDAFTYTFSGTTSTCRGRSTVYVVSEQKKQQKKLSQLTSPPLWDLFLAQEKKKPFFSRQLKSHFNGRVKRKRRESKNRWPLDLPL